MEKAIVYLNGNEDPDEMGEYFSNLGYVPHIVDSRNELLGDLATKGFDKVFLEVNCLTDILLLGKIRTLCPHLEMVVVMKPSLKEVINILQDRDFRIIYDITKIKQVQETS